jgi:hypothetical protein
MQVPNPVTRSGEATRDEVAISREFFIDTTDKEGQMVLDQALLDFGFQPRGRANQRTVKLTNRTNAKVTAEWAAVQGADPGFRVEPSTVDIGPHRTQEFTVRGMEAWAGDVGG